MSKKKKKIIWRWIPGYKGRYRVSTHGKVKSYVKNPEGVLLKMNPNKSGYPQVTLKPEKGTRDTRRVHSLVLLAFRGEPATDQQCRHLDGTRDNNRLDNLVWGTAQENTNDKFRHGTILFGEDVNTTILTTKQVKQIRKLFSKRGNTITLAQVAEEYSVGESTISAILKNKTWKHIDSLDCSNRPRAQGTPPPACSLATAQEIRNKYVEESVPSTQLAEDYDVSQATVSFILNKKGHYKNLEGPEITHKHRMGPGRVTEEMIEDIRHEYAVNRVYTTVALAHKHNICPATANNIINASGPYSYLGKKVRRADKFSSQQLRLIRSMAARGVKQKVIAAEFYVDQSEVSRIVNRRGRYA